MKRTTIPWWPSPYDERRAWLIAFKAQIATLGGAVGMTAPELSQFNSFCDSAVNTIDNVTTKENAYESSLADRQSQTDSLMAFLRPIIRRIKQNPNYTPTIGETLDIVSESIPVDPATVKPSLTLMVQPGGVRVRIKRDGADSVNLYMRRAGQTTWTFICRVELATCEDTTPLLNPAVPELREYRVVGVIGDAEVGIPSDPKQVIYAANLAA